MSERRKIRQSDIAAASGVSVSTVSRVLNDLPGISRDIRAQVMDVAASLGYASARQRLTTARSVAVLSTIRFFSSEAGQFHTDILEGIAQEARRTGVALTCCPVGNDAENAAALAGRDGVLLLSIDTEAVIEQAAETGIALGLINVEQPRDQHDVTVPDNRDGARKGLKHLIELGHRDIVFLNHSDRDTIRRRAEGYAQAMVAGTAVPPRIEPFDYTQSAATNEARLRAIMDERPFTALACSNDISAIAAKQALRRMGLTVPRDVSVLGFDDLPMAGLAAPALSTVRIDRHAIGAMALKRLMDRMDDPAAPTVRQIISTALVIRDSTAKPPERD
ncbi:LacI family DNA-binding transcriptional regulator [Roseobacter weihaiensis]|uniref:LacI family DNA-binding transcriptional regulator n=1 Tax=Roseobacter weihaiensis TaxID=2763262 RepID=UPI001D0AB1B7|nr:LacI family DNA-binding transcriptional regulator [Roseobacter sp. H9]